MNQFGHVLTRIAAEPLAFLFERRIAEPLQMNPEKWRWGSFGKLDGIHVNGGSGNSNKHMFIIPGWNMVVVRLGLDQQDRKITDETYGRFLEMIGQSICH